MHTNEGIVEFKPSVWGLHYRDVSDPESNILRDTLATKLRGQGKRNAFKA